MRALRRLLFLVCTLIASCAATAPAYAQSAKTFVPPAAHKLLPDLREVQERIWPAAPMPSFLAAQVEQESCISLKHSKCWNPRAELKTSREYGFGLGQITIAYRADGSVRFNKFNELRQQYASLRSWAWENRYDAAFQLTAMVEMDKGIFNRQADTRTTQDRLAFTLSAYNGGESGVKQDRMLCRNTAGCNPGVWFDNVENTSLKSKAKWKGYGASPFHINREYVVNVLQVRRPKYEPFFERR